MELREKLLNLRKSKNYTQGWLASKLGISISAIKKYENEKNPITPEISVLRKYANHFGVSFDYLLNDNIENKTAKNIEIGKVIGLSDKAIANLEKQRSSNNGINLLLESDFLSEINELLDFHYIFLHLLNDVKQTANEDSNINKLAQNTMAIIDSYNNYCKENPHLTLYSYNLTDNLNDAYLDVIDNSITDIYFSEQDLLNSLMEDLGSIYTIIQNACKSVKLELLEILIKLLQTFST